MTSGERPAAAELYPQHLLPIAGVESSREADLFDLVREQLLIGYGYNTARAYWGDLEHWRDWCWQQEPPIDPICATGQDLARYLDWLSELDYSPNTRARRLTTLRAFYWRASSVTGVCRNPTKEVAPITRRK